LRAVLLIAGVVLAVSACGGGTSHYTVDKTRWCLLHKYGITSALHNGGWVAKVPSGHVRITFTSSHEAAELFNDREQRAAKSLPPALRNAVGTMSVHGNVHLESNSSLSPQDRGHVEGCLK
jgi:hypothetical protein